MRTVQARSWRDLVRSGEVEQTHPAYRGYGYFAKRRRFNKRSLMAALIGLSLLVGLFARAGLVVGFALALFTASLYLRAKALAAALHLRRRAPGKAIEHAEIEIGWEISNQSGFRVSDILLIDGFDGALVSREAVWVAEPIPAHTALQGSYRKTCDAGMGVFGFSPLTAIVSDPLGVFEFLVSEDAAARVEVYPRIEAIPQVPVPGSKESFLYGIYDLPTRGTSVNFSGLRDYARGDPLKHIAWRLSKRHGRLLVKQFEKIANTEISVLLNMDARDHAGRKSESTWEYAKDAALALVTQQMANGNTIQLLSNARQVSWGRGESHANLIARVIFSLEPEADATGRNLADRFFESIPAASTAIFIGPLLNTDPESLFRALLKLRNNDVHVICLLVRPAGFLEGKVHGDSKFLVESGAWKNQTLLDKLVRRLRAEGIAAYLVENHETIGHALLPWRKSAE